MIKYPHFKNIKTKLEEIDEKSILNVSMEIDVKIYNELILEGYKQAIEDLRELQNRFRHQSKWNHSMDAFFAPVELSDWLLVNKYWPLKKNINKAKD